MFIQALGEVFPKDLHVGLIGRKLFGQLALGCQQLRPDFCDGGRSSRICRFGCSQGFPDILCQDFLGGRDRGDLALQVTERAVIPRGRWSRLPHCQVAQLTRHLLNCRSLLLAQLLYLCHRFLRVSRDLLRRRGGALDGRHVYLHVLRGGLDHGLQLLHPSASLSLLRDATNLPKLAPQILLQGF